jgi:leader peptidase (prepilin peptidase)/N-methyltransferase
VTTGLALGWAAAGLVCGLLAGEGSLRLERASGLVDQNPADQDHRIERILLPLLGLVGFFFFAKSEAMGPGLLIHSLWIVVLVQILGFDLKHRLILDVVSLPAIVLAVALASFSPHLSVVSSLFGILVGGGVLLPFALISSLFHGGAGFGWGDVKLGMLIGAVTGMSLSATALYTIWALIAGALVGGVVTIALLASRRLGLRDTLPYGPFLVIGCGLVLFFM